MVQLNLISRSSLCPWVNPGLPNVHRLNGVAPLIADPPQWKPTTRQNQANPEEEEEKNL